MTNKYTLNGLKCTVYLCLFFAFSYCSIWGFQLFETSIFEYAYGFLLVLSILFTVIERRLSLHKIGIIMLFCVAIMFFRRASINYLLFYLALFVIVMVGIEEEDIQGISRFINFFAWIQIIGMLICWLLPDFYVRFLSPALSELDYYETLKSDILNGDWNIGFTNQSAHFAGFMALGIGNRILLFRDGNRYLFHRNIIFVILSIIGPYLSGKRAHFAFCIVSLVLIYYLNGYLKRGGNSKAVRFLGILLACLLAFILLWGISLNVEGTFLNEIFDTLGNLGTSDVDITTGRVNFWNVAIQQFKENPILGIGWKSFWHFEFYGVHYDVHNIYLQLLCEVGIMGAVVFYLFFAISLYRAIKIVIKKNIDMKYKKIALFSVFYQVFFLLYGITGNPLYDASFYIMYFISVAFIIPIPMTTLPKTEGLHENSDDHVSPCL